jgi:shikimate 5-dehydrogenase
LGEDITLPAAEKPTVIGAGTPETMERLLIDLPAAPKGPTVYVVSETPGDPGFRSLIASGITALGAGPCDIADIVIGPDPSPADRAAILQFLQDEYNARGAFIFGHATEFFHERADGYDSRDEACRRLGEVGVIVRAPGELRATAPRLAAATAAAQAVLPARTAELLILGAGPDARAFAAAVASGAAGARPAKITLSSIDAKDLAEVRKRLTGDGQALPVEIRHVENAGEHDRLLALMPPGSAIVSAHDDPTASPVGAAALFPHQSTVCDLLAPLGASRLLAEAARPRAASELVIHDSTPYRTERAFAILHKMFGAEASDRQEAALRKAIEKHLAN